VSDDPRRLTTEEQRERLHRGRRAGGMCGVCGRTLGDVEPVYWERFVIDLDWSAERDLGRYVTTLEAPVGVECASPDFLKETEGREPGRCADCGRGVFYRVPRSIRRRVACSWLCRDRAGAAERRRG
jgi:hypothetical protein